MKLPCRENQEHGFTLTELLVAILIIGILAAIAIPMFLNQRKAAQEAALKSDLKNVATSVEGSYNASDQRYRAPMIAPKTDATEALPAINSDTEFGPVRITEGNSVSYLGMGDTFCLTGSHQDAPDNQWFFNSGTGEMSQDIGDCTGVNPSDPDDQIEGYMCHPLVVADLDAETAWKLATTKEFLWAYNSGLSNAEYLANPAVAERNRLSQLYFYDASDALWLAEETPEILAVWDEYTDRQNHVAETGAQAAYQAAYDAVWDLDYSNIDNNPEMDEAFRVYREAVTEVAKQKCANSVYA